MLHWTDHTVAKIVGRIEAGLAIFHPVSNALVASWTKIEMVDVPVGSRTRTSHFKFSSFLTCESFWARIAGKRFDIDKFIFFTKT